MTQDRLPLSAAERLDWLRLIRSENVGPVTFMRLLDRFGSASAAVEAIPALARRGGRKSPLKVAARSAIERELAAAQRIGARLVCLPDPDYPALLAHVDGAPPCLYVRGHAHVLAKPTVGVVGARNASIAARNFARGLAADLGQAGVSVASGLARGLDAAAHEGSLATGTIAVVAGGVDVIYPRENKDLTHAIYDQGAVISEAPPGTEPRASRFPRRNRIIAGLSRAVVVVEATARSGSLITARLAAEHGRDVLAVPGSPMDPRSEGANMLLKDGAILCRGVDDVLEALRSPMTSRVCEPACAAAFRGPVPTRADEQTLEAARADILDAMSPTPTTVDEILRRRQLSPAVVSMVLLELELAGRLERHPGNRVSLLS